MNSKSKSPVGVYYEKHHVKGDRLRQTFMGDVRGPMFSSWIGSGRVVLDLGGRDGSLTQHYMSANRVVIGDVDCAALAHAKERYGIETKEVNLNEQLPFEDGTIDAVVMGEVLEHLPYPRFVLGEVKRVLRGGGAVHRKHSTRLPPHRSLEGVARKEVVDCRCRPNTSSIFQV